MKNKIRLKNIATIKKGQTSALKKVGYPYLSLRYLRGGAIEEYTDNGTWVNKGDILIVVTGGNAGEIIRAKDGFLPAPLAKIKINNKRFNKDFIYHQLKQHEQYLKHVSQTASYHFMLDFDALKNLLIENKPFKEQEAYVHNIQNSLKSIDEMIAENHQRSNNVAEAEKVLMRSLFQKYATTEKRIKDIATVKTTLSPKQSDKGIELSLATAHNIQNGRVENPETIQVEKQFIANHHLASSNDILMSVVGDDCGKVALVDDDVLPSQSLVRIRSKHYRSIYVCCHLLKNTWRQFSKGSSIPAINSRVVKNQKIDIVCNYDDEKTMFEQFLALKTYFEHIKYEINRQDKLLKQYRLLIEGDKIHG